MSGEISTITVQVKLRGFLENYTNRETQFLKVEAGCTLAEVINRTLEQLGGDSRDALLDKYGNLHGGIEVFYNREHISAYQLNNVNIWQDSEVIIVPIIAGGSVTRLFDDNKEPTCSNMDTQVNY